MDIDGTTTIVCSSLLKDSIERQSGTSLSCSLSKSAAASSGEVCGSPISDGSALMQGELDCEKGGSGRGFELLALDPAQLEQPNECLLDQVVRARCAGGNADHHWTRRQPEVRNNFAFLVQVVVLD